MIKETMTVHEALSELKMLDKRICAKISDTKYCVANKHSSTKIDGMPIEDYKKITAEKYQAVRDLIRRRAAIKKAMSLSNASTYIEIDGVQYTIAEAIEMKRTGNDLKSALLMKMTSCFNEASRTLSSYNGEKLTEKADVYVNGLFGQKEKNVSSADIEAVRNAYIAANTYDLIDPIGIQEQLVSLDTEIETFASKVDSKISISNAVTTITVEY